MVNDRSMLMIVKGVDENRIHEVDLCRPSVDVCGNTPVSVREAMVSHVSTTLKLTIMTAVNKPVAALQVFIGFAKFVAPLSQRAELLSKRLEPRFPAAELPKTGKKVKAMIVHYNSPDSFYVQKVIITVYRFSLGQLKP